MKNDIDFWLITVTLLLLCEFIFVFCIIAPFTVLIIQSLQPETQTSQTIDNDNGYQSLGPSKPIKPAPTTKPNQVIPPSTNPTQVPVKPGIQEPSGQERTENYQNQSTPKKTRVKSNNKYPTQRWSIKGYENNPCPDQGKIYLEKWAYYLELDKAANTSLEFAAMLAYGVYKREYGLFWDPLERGLMQTLPETRQAMIDMTSYEELLMISQILGYVPEESLKELKKSWPAYKIRDKLNSMFFKDPEVQIVIGILALRMYVKNYGPLVGAMAYHNPTAAKTYANYFLLPSGEIDKVKANLVLTDLHFYLKGEPTSKFTISNVNFDAESISVSPVDGVERRDVGVFFDLAEKSGGVEVTRRIIIYWYVGYASTARPPQNDRDEWFSKHGGELYPFEKNDGVFDFMGNTFNQMRDSYPQ